MPTRLLIAILRHRRILWMSTALAIVATLLATFLCRQRFNHDLAFFFPTHSISGNMYRTLQKSRLTQTIQLEIQLNRSAEALRTEQEGPTAKSWRTTENRKALDTIAEKLASLRDVASATACFSQGVTAPLDDIITTIPYTTSPAVLDTANPAAAVANLRKALTLPGTPIDMFRMDPFGFRLPLLERLQQFQTLSGLTVDATDGYLISPDGSRALILVNTDFARPPNGGDIRALFKGIERTVAEILPEAKTTIVSPLQHNLENEMAVRRDILAVSLTSFIALLLLFFLIYKGAWDAVLIPLIPLAATIIVTGVMAICFHSLCMFIVGIGGGIAGLAVDQGIHVYGACAYGTETCGSSPMQNLRRLLMPLSLSVITSAAVFLLVTFTGIAAYIQLGIFAAATLLLNLFLSVTLLPTLLKKHPKTACNMTVFHPSPRLATFICTLWLLLIIGAICFFAKLKTDFSIRAMDGTSAETVAAEEAFQQRWLNPEAGAMLVLTADSTENALTQCEQLADNPVLKQAPLFHPAAIWPSASTRQRHLDAWRTPKTRQRLRQLQLQLQAECAKAALPPRFFDKAFDRLYATLDSPTEMQEPPTFQAISRHLLRPYGSSTTAILLTGAPKITQTADILQSLQATPNVALVTSDAFQQAAAADIRPRLNRILLLLAPVLLLTLFPVLKHPQHLLIIALPGVTALLIGGGLAAAFGYKLTLVSLFSLVMLTGLVLDYGIFALHIAQSREQTSVQTSLVLSAATTILTTGALLASRHPVMLHTGLVLSVGILLTALTALFVVPSLLSCSKGKLFRILPLLLLLACVSGCMTNLTPQSLPQTHSDDEIIQFNKKFYALTPHIYTMKTSYLWMDFTMLLALRADGRTIQAVGTATNGITLLSVTGTDPSEQKYFFSDAIPPIAKRKFFPSLVHDLERIFANPLESLPHYSLTYGGNPCRLLEKKHGCFPLRDYQVVYYNWNDSTHSYDTIKYRNFNTHTTITLKRKQ